MEDFQPAAGGWRGRPWRTFPPQLSFAAGSPLDARGCGCRNTDSQTWEYDRVGMLLACDHWLGTIRSIAGLLGVVEDVWFLSVLRIFLARGEVPLRERNDQRIGSFRQPQSMAYPVLFANKSLRNRVRTLQGCKVTIAPGASDMENASNPRRNATVDVHKRNTSYALDVYLRGRAFCTTRLSHIASLVLRLLHIFNGSFCTRPAIAAVLLLHYERREQKNRGISKFSLALKVRRLREILSARRCCDALELGGHNYGAWLFWYKYVGRWTVSILWAQRNTVRLSEASVVVGVRCACIL
ncbi:uncharacterized protein B0H18DRAFT_956883 [Fomitopsis serialis]|uniref:uncharacterized protein n=1 Tax=Fomitopsis serialis TaxID=139415 RepID=UPI0020077EFE|nr:uncharacterized protein B0H18DRAFT_956883 [Neoantrodia serialis]KAH9920746.1 hypothetical protein B0H18DRAFT_956883 [Neoantrodia serialis]